MRVPTSRLRSNVFAYISNANALHNEGARGVAEAGRSGEVLPTAQPVSDDLTERARQWVEATDEGTSRQDRKPTRHSGSLTEIDAERDVGRI